MKKSTMRLIFAIVGVVLGAMLLAGLLGGLSSGSSAIGNMLNCDHINTTKEYESNGSMEHICTEVCEDCGILVGKVGEPHATFVSDIRSTTVNGSAANIHDVIYECRDCHYTYKDYQNHVYNSYSSVCMGCGDLCLHPGMPTTPGTDGKIHCPICPYWEDPTSTCEHKWSNSQCTECGVTCTHDVGLGLDSEADEPYYFCYRCDYVQPVTAE